jgi:hypothetical protein
MQRQILVFECVSSQMQANCVYCRSSVSSTQPAQIKSISDVCPAWSFGLWLGPPTDKGIVVYYSPVMAGFKPRHSPLASIYRYTTYSPFSFSITRRSPPSLPLPLSRSLPLLPWDELDWVHSDQSFVWCDSTKTLADTEHHLLPLQTDVV